MCEEVKEQQSYKWYILHTYTGYEKIVQSSLEQMIVNNHLQDTIVDIRIPTETVIEERNGKKKAYEAKIYPGYVFVKLIYSPQIWFLLTNTRGVTGFVGPGGKATPMTQAEVKRMGLETVVTDFDVHVGDSVTAISGPFEGHIGVVKDIDAVHQKATVSINMFGRKTPVNMDFIQIEKINNPVIVEQDSEE